MKIDTETDEGKAELQKLIDKETEGLKSKNAELLGKTKKLQSDIEAITDQVKELADAKTKAEEEAAQKSGNVDEVKKLYEGKLTDLNKKLSEKDSAINEILIDKGLTDSLVKAKVASQHFDAVLDHIKARNKAEVVMVDGKPTARIGGKSIEEFVTEFSQSEKGKHYIAAPVNGGGGANGENGNPKGGAAKEIKRSDFSALPPEKKMEHVKSGGTVTD